MFKKTAMGILETIIGLLMVASMVMVVQMAYLYLFIPERYDNLPVIYMYALLYFMTFVTIKSVNINI
jgi:hypothetical protein